MQEGSRKAIIAAFFANLGIAVAKFTGFLITRSAGLLAESRRVADRTAARAERAQGKCLAPGWKQSRRE